MVTATTLLRSDERSDEDLADAAIAALVAEAELTPKPALVDGRDSGVHSDMDLAMMHRSAHALRDTFVRLARIGHTVDDDRALRIHLAAAGRDGEHAMMTATGGVNTHRGAIWALGLAVGATAATRSNVPSEILTKVAAIAAHDDPAGQHESDRLGARARARYRVGGAITEARNGFPHAAAALDQLRASRDHGRLEHHARLDALLAAMSGLQDTCLLARGGLPALDTARRGARSVLRHGGVGTSAGARALDSLDRRLCALGVSPGGSADLLALALFLDHLEAPCNR
ncbi:triphosphoribosyl-dephospho-CoA synthase [Gordonia sp. NPDC003424]